MADSVGQIGLDLVVNQNQFKQQMSGIQGLAKKAGAALAAAFAVKKIIDFGAQCVELGSDLAEVQNVVDVTFPRMSKQVDAFAKNAIISFGLSETMAKKFTGTFGAMAKAFGFNEQAAYDMSTTLTGLAGDVASFYNISQDEAYTKLKSVFTGETETLKDLGVVMTQNALDAYAMANGFGKTTQNMSEMEKVALRYQFVQDQLAASSGDFIRTSDGWANQVRVLKLQFDSLKATIGQGLINVLTPVIKVINTIIGKLMSLANAFKSFTELITGKKGSGGSASVAAAGMDGVTDAADNAGQAMGGAGSAAKKAAKDIKTATTTTGIDELNVLNPDTGSGGAGGGGSDYAADEFEMGEIDTSAVEEADSKFKGLLDRLKELRDIFMDGFKAGLGDVTLEPLMEAIEGIKKSLTEIFTDPAVVDAFNNWLDTMAYSLGQIAGAMASIGITIATNLLGGLNRYLDQNKDLIKHHLINMFNISAEIAAMVGDFAQAFANIFSVFGAENGQRVTAAIIGIFANAFMGVNELCMKLVRDIIDVITRPFIDNQEGFKSAIDGFLGALATSLETVKGVVDNTMQKIGEVYDAHVKPMFDALAGGLSDIVGVMLNAYHQHIQPVLDNLADKLRTFAEQYLQPMINKAVDLIGKIADVISLLWTNILQPFISWILANNVIPNIAGGIQDLGNILLFFGGLAAEVISHVIDTLSWFADYIINVFNGEWQLTWSDISIFFQGIWSDDIANFMVDIWESICSACSSALNMVKTIIQTRLNEIKTFWVNVFNNIKTALSTVMNNIKTNVSNAMTAVKLTFITILTSIQTGASTVLESLKAAFVNAFTYVRDTVTDILNGLWSNVKTAINYIISGIEIMANAVINGINTVVNALNNLQFTIPEWVPGFGGNSFGFSIPTLGTVSLPRLAQGGFVRANTPQLAMIGDNRHYGEIVAPEDKMQEMVDRAVAMASRPDGMSEQYLSIMVELLQKIIELIENLELVVNIDIREIRQKLVDLEKRSGYSKFRKN